MNSFVRRMAPAGLAALCAATVGLGAFFGAPASATVGRGFSASFGEEGSGAGEFSGPTGLAVNQSSGDVYVADTGNDRVEYFTGSGSYLSQFNGSAAPTGKFSAPEAIAVDNDPSSAAYGDVYVADTNHGVIDKFSATGVYLGQLAGICPQPGTCPGTGIPFGIPHHGNNEVLKNHLQGLAVDASGNLWVLYYANEYGAVAEFADTGDFLKGIFYLGGELTTAFGVDASDDVDLVEQGELVEYNSAGVKLAILGRGIATWNALAIDPSTNEIYLGIETSVRQIGASGQQFGEAELGEGGGRGLAIGSTSKDIYVADSIGDRVDIFVNGEGPEVPSAENATDVQSSSATLHGELSPGGMVGKVEYQFTYNVGTSCAGGPSIPVRDGEVVEGKQAHVEVGVSGLQPNAQYTYCLTATNPYGSKRSAEESFTTRGAIPSVVAESASEVTETGATLYGQVNPNNQDTTYYFNYGPTTAYGSTIPLPPGTDIGAAFGDQRLSVQVSGLNENTLYHYQLVAIDATGESRSADEIFVTAAPVPTVTTGAASEVIYNAAMVSGTVTPGSAGPASDTRWCFEYGTVGEYGYGSGFVPLLPGDAGQGTAAIPVSARLTGLVPGRSYRYRVVAVNSLDILGSGSSACGTTGGHEGDGAEATFTTPITPVPPSAETGAASNVSQNGATITGIVDPDGTATTYAFQIGVDTDYGVQLFGEAGTGSESQTFSLSVGELQPGTTYHYRLVASNVGGTTYGADATFTTPVFASAVLTAPLAEPLLATPALAFPAVPAEAATPSKKTGKAKKRSAKHKKPRGRAERKPKKNAKAGRTGHRGLSDRRAK